MRINLHLAEPFWRTVGQRNLSIDIHDEAVLADLIELLKVRYPDLGDDLSEGRVTVFADDEEANPETPLHDKVSVHFVWPVAGG